MKKLILIMILIPVFAFAFNENEESIISDVEVVALSKDVTGTTFSVNFVQPELVEDENSLNRRYTFSPGCGVLSQPGHPIVPFISRYVRLQPTGNAHVEIINSHYTSRIIPDYVVAEGSSLDDLNENLTEDGFFPADIVDIGEPGILREFRVTPVKMCPVQVNQETGEVRTYDHIEYRVVYDQGESENELENYPIKISQTFLPVYQQFLDWQLDELDDYEIYRGGIIVVLPSSFDSVFTPWIEWKRQKGYQVDILSSEGNENGIKRRIQDFWDNSNIKADFLVLVADSGPIPPFSYEYWIDPWNTYYIQGDFDYATLVGSDEMVDIALGRISVESIEELDNYCEKVLDYEKYPLVDNTRWSKKYYSPDPQSRYELSNYGMEQENNLQYWRSNSAPSITSAFPFANEEFLDEMENFRKYPLFISDEIDFDPWYYGDPTFSELLIRADSCGAIALFGSSDEGTYSRRHSLVIGGISAISYHNTPLTVGQVYLGGYSLYDRNIYGSYDVEFRPHIISMGDPSLWLYTDVPDPIEVTIPQTVYTGRHSHIIEVTSNNEPLEGAWVTLYKSGSPYPSSIGETDENGIVNLETRFYSVGEIFLTVTAENYIPFIDTLDVVESNILETEIYTVYEDNTHGSFGNGNGIIEANEIIALKLKVQNHINRPIGTLQLTIADDGEYIDSTWGSINITDIPGNSHIISESLLYLKISPQIPNDWRLTIPLDIQLDEFLLSENFFRNVKAPEYVIRSVESNLEPGDNGYVYFEIKNVGESYGPTALISVLSDEGWVDVISNPLPLLGIGIDSSLTTSGITIHSSSRAFHGYTFDAKVIISFFNGRVDTLTTRIPIGTASATDPLGPDNYGYIAYDNVDGHILSPDYEWMEINPEETNYDFYGESLFYNNDEGYLDLPFEFIFYGQSYTSLTVSPYGLVAPGRVEGRWRNDYPIPSLISPPGFIAPMWGMSGIETVFYYVDEINNKVILEWYDTAEEPNIYQVIIDCNYDEFCSDSEFIFQYKNLNPSEGFRIGMQNQDHTGGLLLQTSSHPYPGMSAITRGSAIRITTRRFDDNGIISGQVTTSLESTPVQGMTVISQLGGLSDVTNSNGEYSIVIPYGNQSLILRKDGYPEILTDEIIIENEDEVIFNIEVPRAIITTEPEEVNVSINSRQSESRTVTVTNNGDFSLTYETGVSVTHPDSGYTGVKGNYLYHMYVGWVMESDNYGENIISLRDNQLISPQLKLFNSNSEELYSLDLNSSEEFSHIDVYKDKILLLSDECIHIGTFQNDEFIILSSIPVPIYPINEIVFYRENLAYLFSGRTFYSFDLQNYIREEIIDDIGLPFFDGDSAYYRVDAKAFPGINLVISTFYREPDPMGGFYYNTVYREFNLETGIGEMIPNMRFEDSFAAKFFIYDKNNGVVQDIALTNYDRGIDVYEYVTYKSWLDIPEIIGAELAPGASDSYTITVNPDYFVNGHYDAWVRFTNSSVDGNHSIPVHVECQSLDIEYETSAPEIWALENIYPNPFNPTTNVEFALVETAEVKVKLYNIMGQEVALVLDQKMNAGYHRVTVDGTLLASGVYFLEFKAGPIRDVRKIVLLK